MPVNDILGKMNEILGDKGYADTAEGGVLPNPDSPDCYDIEAVKTPKWVENPNISALGIKGSFSMRVKLLRINNDVIPKYEKLMGDKVVQREQRKADAEGIIISPEQLTKLRGDAKIEIGREYDQWLPITALRSLKESLQQNGIQIDNAFECCVGKKIRVCGTGGFIRNGKAAKAIKMRLIPNGNTVNNIEVVRKDDM